MKIVTTGRKILLLLILLSPLALYLESCKKVDTSTPTNTLPILTTTIVSSITATNAITGGNISSAGGLPIQSRGVVWSTSPNPTIALNTKTIDGSGTGSFISTLSGFSPDTTYFVRAYATTSLGTAYGNEVNFKFSSISSVGNQQGNKLVGLGAIGNALQGKSVSISADGNTLVFSGPADNGETGAIWIYNRTNNAWNQVAKLVVSGAVGKSFQNSVAISADGKTVIVGGSGDNSFIGAAWIFTQNNGIWAQQGSKLVGAGAIGKASQGSSVSISSDGNTVVIGGAGDNTDVGSGNGFFIDDAVGAAWIFTRSNDVWTQQGTKLVGSGAIGKAMQGSSVSISGEGNTVVIGGDADNDFIGATWIFTRNNGMWAQQGSKLIGTGAAGQTLQGNSVSISSDGNTVIIGGPYNPGAAWIFTRNNGMWAQQGSKLVGSGNVGFSRQGRAVSISGDGNTVVIGGDFDNGFTNSQGSSFGIGASWIFKRNNGMWAQQGSKLVGSNNIGYSMQGSSVSINSDGKTVAVGGPGDNANKGAVWIFNR
ncbi:MAG: hypothetical protein WKF85_06915 [Chitinophagaceae bacterium]